MKHYGVYWPFFSKKTEPWPLDGWRIGAGSRLADAKPGDVLWLFSSGTKCKKRLAREGIPTDGIEDHLGYLAQILVVDQIIPDEVDDFRLLIKGKPNHCPAVKPPLLIDECIRPEKSDPQGSIGTIHQAAWKLPEQVVDLLMAGLNNKGYSIAF